VTDDRAWLVALPVDTSATNRHAIWDGLVRMSATGVSPLPSEHEVFDQSSEL